MAKKPATPADKTIASLSQKAAFNKAAKATPAITEQGTTTLVGAAKMDDAGLGRAYSKFMKPLRTESLVNAGIDYGKGTSLKQVENMGGIFSNLSPAQEKLMTRAQNAKLKLAASKAAKKMGK